MSHLSILRTILLVLGIYAIAGCNESVHRNDPMADTNLQLIQGVGTGVNNRDSMLIRPIGKDSVLLKFWGANWSDQYIGVIQESDSNRLSVLGKERLQVSLCKSSKWGEPFLGIAVGNDPSSLDFFSRSNIEVSFVKSKSDTTIKIHDSLTFVEFEQRAQDSSIVQLSINHQANTPFEFQPLKFNYVRTMICADFSRKETPINFVSEDSILRIENMNRAYVVTRTPLP